MSDLAPPRDSSGSNVDLPGGAADRQFDAYLASPAISRTPAILLLPEMFGLSPAMRQAADDYARDGHVALVPNLFWRAQNPATIGYDGEQWRAANDRLEGFDIDLAVQDLAQAVALLRERAGTEAVVAVGHCIGGRIAVLAQARLGLAGAVSYYGLGLSNYPADLARLSGPVQLHYGLADPHVSSGEIDAVTGLVAARPNVAVYCYPEAGHSFVNPFRPMFDSAKAALVRQRTTDLLHQVASVPTAAA